ncbi:MAG: hypothetical protein AAGI28_08840 [Pseudomonadota bacterium]
MRALKFSTVLFAAALAGCVSAPRGPAASLAASGAEVSAALGTEFRATAREISNIDRGNTFRATLDRCTSFPTGCAVVAPSQANEEARQKLVQAIALRASAAAALEGAYLAMGEEAQYDARGDMELAVGEAISAVNAYSDFVLATPGASLIGGQVGEIAKFVSGLLAERQQRKRLLQASALIREANETFRNALLAEAAIHASLRTYIIDSRTDARVALFDAGLVSGEQLVGRLADDLGLALRKNADRVLRRSDAARMAARATIAADAREEVRLAQSRYSASVAALGALIRTHQQFEAERSVTLGDVARFLAELDAVTDPAVDDE